MDPDLLTDAEFENRFGFPRVTRIWDGINVIADDRVPEGYVGIDGARGLELIRIDVNVVEDAPMTTNTPPDAGERDTLAQALFTMRPSHRWEHWDDTSEGQRQWCRVQADQLIAQGWRRVGADQVVVIVNRGVWESIVDDLRQHVSPRRVQAILQSVAALAPEPSDD